MQLANQRTLEPAIFKDAIEHYWRPFLKPPSDPSGAVEITQVLLRECQCGRDHSDSKGWRLVCSQCGGAVRGWTE